MSLQDPVGEESQENGEDDLNESWQETAKNNIVTFKGVIEEFTLVEPENEEDKLPEQLLEVGNIILYISLGIKSAKSHEEDFKRLLGDATSLVIVFWQIYKELGIPGPMWPPPNLRIVIDKLVDTVYSIHKLLKRKSHENVVTRILVGYFGLRDLGKFKKYQRKLDYVASRFQNEPINININEVLLDVIENPTPNQDEGEDEDEDEGSELSEEPAEVPVRKNKRAAKVSAERSRLRTGKAKQNEVETDNSEDERVGVEENKAAKKKTAKRQAEARPEPTGTKGTKKTKTRRSDSDKEPLESKDKGKARHQESDEDVEEGTSRQRSRTNNAAQSKTKQRVSPASDDEEYDTDEPVSDPVAPKVQPKKKPVSTPKQKVKSTPMSPQYPISGISITNDSGNMANMNIGNVYNSTISDANNDNSVNTFRKRKPA